MDVDWGTIPDWFGVALAAVATIIAVVIAYVVWKQTQRLAEKELSEARQLADRENNLAHESYLRDRMQNLVDFANDMAQSAHQLFALTSPRHAELLGDDGYFEKSRDEHRELVHEQLSLLAARRDLLRTFALTMPELGAANDSSALDRLMDEGAWLYTDALHAAILRFSDDHDVVDMTNRNEVVDALMNGSFGNLNTRLLSACRGLDPDRIPYYGEPGSPWPAIYKAREVVMTSIFDGGLPSSLTEAAGWVLMHTLDRYEDALVDVLRAWGASQHR